MHIGHLLGSGRTADVYAFGDSWVLRRYRDGTDATHELAVMSYLSASGYPVPRIGPPADPALPNDLVMQRLTGPTMARSLLSGAVTATEGGEMLAGLLHELHSIPPRLSQDPADRILHLDLHPENVLLTREGPVVIDWATASEGPPGLDRAMSSLILAQVALDPSFPRSEQLKILLATLLARFADDGGIPGPALDRALAIRAANPTLTAAETALLGEAAGLVTTLAG